ncbi:MAG: hypothetical protein JJD98_00255 [Polaromonas sp.]|nr:hypothetical protein [Polaromonas sp.]
MLIENWQDVVTKAWSMRLILLAGLLSGLEVAMPAIAGFFEPLDLIPAGTFAVLAALVSAGAGIARIVSQPKTLP